MEEKEDTMKGVTERNEGREGRERKERKDIERRKVIIMGAAGRDFHNFNVFFRDNKLYEVVAFTATQIPSIEGRRYPPVLSGRRYPRGIPIYREEEILKLIKLFNVDIVVLAYSDILHEDVMHKASLAVAAGADFWLIGPKSSQLIAKKPVIAVTASRTGAGKTTVARAVCQALKELGKHAVVIRHPMPYGDLEKQICQRFASLDDLGRHQCTIEEMEEYTPYLKEGFVVYAGVDYKRILQEAEKEADIIVYEGGNNDFPLIKPSLKITVVDPHRVGHELISWPGEVNVRTADIIVINKVDTAPSKNVDDVEKNVRKINAHAIIIKTSSQLFVDDENLIKGKNVAVVEDAPTVTHGGLKSAAGYFAAKQFGGRIVDPKRYAVGTLKAIITQYNLSVIPTLGYTKEHLNDLRETINAMPVDAIVLATSADLLQLITINKPCVRVCYNVDKQTYKKMKDMLRSFL
jgi:predicted GTPase